MIVNKITTGIVVQKFDTDAQRFVAQEFVAGDQIDFENELGEAIEPFDDYLPYDMKQPISPIDESGRLVAIEHFLSNPTDEEWAKLRNMILSQEPLRVIVTIDGGNYQGAAATGPVVVDILDYDNWKACDAAHQDEAKYYADLEAEVERLQADPTATLL